MDRSNLAPPYLSFRSTGRDIGGAQRPAARVCRMTGNSCQVVAAGPADMEPLISVMVLALAQAIAAFRSRRLVWRTIGSLGAVLLLWPLRNSLYPAPPWPGDVWPLVVAAWLALGALLVFFRPSVARFGFVPQSLGG
jgi:hypothetical protein